MNFVAIVGGLYAQPIVIDEPNPAWPVSRGADDDVTQENAKHYPPQCAEGDYWCSMPRLPAYLSSFEYTSRTTRRPTAVYSLMSLAARAVKNVDKETFNRAPEDVRDFLQRYIEWWNQIGLYNPIRGWWANGRPRYETHAHTVSAYTGPPVSSAPAMAPRWVWHGSYKQWNADGQLKVHAHYDCDELHGVKTEWDDYGYMCQQYTYRHGKQHGVCRYWNHPGSSHTVYEYKDGKLHGERVKYCTATGMTILKDTWVDGKTHGLVREWDRNGVLTRWSMYNHGTRDGLDISMCPRGSWPASVRFYINGKVMPVRHNKLVSMRTGVLVPDIICDHPLMYPPEPVNPRPATYVTTESAIETATWEPGQNSGRGTNGQYMNVTFGTSDTVKFDFSGAPLYPN